MSSTSQNADSSVVNRRALVTALLGHFTNDGNSVVFSVLIAYYVKVGIPLAFLGAALAGSNLISGFLSERIGFWADRSGKRGAMMAFGIGLMGVASIIFSASFYLLGVAWLVLIPGVLLLGVGLAFYHPLGGSIIAFATRGRSFSKQMGITGSLGSVGRALFPTLLTGFILLLGISLGMLAFGIGILLIGIVIYLTSRNFDTYMVGETKKEAAAKPSLRPYRRFILTLTTIFFLSAVFSSGITNYIPRYFDYVYNSTSLAAIIYSVVLVTPIVGQPVQGFVVGRIGGRKAMYITISGSAAVFALFLMTHNPAIQIVSLAALSFFVFTGFPVIIGYASQVVPRENITRANAIVWGLGSTVGSSVGSLLSGNLIQGFGFQLAFTVCWGFGLAAVAMLPLLPRKAGEERRP